MEKYAISKKSEADMGPKPEEPVKEVEIEKTEEELASPNLYPLPMEEVVRRLREINQAIRLFGEISKPVKYMSIHDVYIQGKVTRMRTEDFVLLS